MKHPGETDASEQPAVIRLKIDEESKPAVNSEHENAVNRTKIRSQGNPEIGLICYDVAAVATNPKLAYLSAHHPDPKSMGQLVTENVHHHRFWQPHKCDYPKNRPEREKPEF